MPSIASLVSLLPAALALAGSASAATIGSRDPTREYYVRTFAVEHNRFDNMYLYGINIDAGVKSALLSPFRSSAVKGYMDESQQWFAYGTQYPYGLNMNEDTLEAGLRDVTLTSNDGTKGFKFGANGIEWDGDKGFGGWVACEAETKTDPVLHWVTNGEGDDALIPVRCAKVNINATPI
ncbi:hypothetical protein FQN54_002280 [Arachnomyces sp. PD_36]|nr:hypothetical protein FQN54_002280 [Arachnomyces sp. PD_36]